MGGVGAEDNITSCGWNKTLNFMASLWMGGSTAAPRLQPLRGDNLLFTTKFPEIPGTHFIDLRKMKGRVESWF